MTFQIQNMVCPSCQTLLHERLVQAGLPPTHVALGSVDFSSYLSEKELKNLDAVLTDLGFVRLQTRRGIVLGQIKSAAFEWVSGKQLTYPYTWSHFVSTKLELDYSYLSHLFREETGQTVEGFIIALRVEKAKEWLRDTRKTLTDIADEMGYSSLPHFSAQFKKEVGKTPSAYRRVPLPPSTLQELLA
jgi:AraC-like DNA-binding protein